MYVNYNRASGAELVDVSYFPYTSLCPLSPDTTNMIGVTNPFLTELAAPPFPSHGTLDDVMMPY